MTRPQLVPTSTERTAAKRKRCDGCGEEILAGDRYLEHRFPPNRAVGNNVWLTKVECLACAGRLGRRADQALEHFAVPLFDVDGVC